MENIRQLGALIEQATSDTHSESPFELYEKILTLINSRADMPKHTINAISKRLSFKNKKILYYSFDLLQYLSYHCELSLYSQISTKEFLLKISSLLMAKDIDPIVHEKILQTIKTWDELFRPHQDLLPMFFQFYAGLLKKEFPIPHGYTSPYRPKDFKVQKKVEQKRNQASQFKRQTKPAPSASKAEQKTFEEIRQKLILTNQIIDNANPADGVKGNELLIQMMEQVKASQKKINETINENPSQKIMELALAANDDIYITYRRYKDLQKNRKPEPFILTELPSDYAKSMESKSKKQSQQKEEPKNQNIFDYDEPKKPSPVKKQQISPVKKQEHIDILNLDIVQKKEETQGSQGNIFDLMDISPVNKVEEKQPVNLVDDLLGGPSSNSQKNINSNPYGQQNINLNPYASNMQNNESNMFLGSQQSTSSPISFGTITLNTNTNFTTEADMQHYGQPSKIEQKLTDLSDLFKK